MWIEARELLYTHKDCDIGPLTHNAPGVLVFIKPCISSNAMLSCSSVEQFTSLPAEVPTHEHNAWSRHTVSRTFGRRLIRAGSLRLLPLLSFLKVLLCRLEGVDLLD